MAENPSLIPADLIAEAGADLTQKLTAAARAAVEEALAAGAAATVAEVVVALESLTESLPPLLVAEIEATLPLIAAAAIERAQVEIAPAREETGQGFPPVPPEPAGDYSGWAASASAALIAAARGAAEAADTAEAARAAVLEAAADPAPFTVMAETAAARTINDARLNTFRTNSDIVKKLEYVAVRDNKTSEVCQYLDNASFSVFSKNIPRPPVHNGCRSYLLPITNIKRKAGATEAEIERQNWAIFRRLEREAKAKEAEGRSDERLEFRFSPDLSDSGTFSGYASVWNELDRHATAFAHGAFAASLSEHRNAGHRLPMLWNHAPDNIIGAWELIEEDAHGLKVKGRIVTETRAGAEAYALLKAGSLNGLSVGFRRLRDEPRRGGGRTILQADLAEISLVGIPSAKSARVTEVRASPDKPAPPDEPAAGAAKPHEEMKMSETTAPAGADETRTAVDALARRLDKIEARGSRLPLSTETGNDNDLERRAFNSFIKKGKEALAAEEVRALTVSTDSAGGFTVPDDFKKEMVKNLVLFSPIRQAARVSQAVGSEILLPVRSGNLTAAWVSETAARPATQPTYGQVKLTVHEMACYVDVSNQLLEDSAFQMESELAADFGEEFGRLEGATFLNGTGTGQPKGLLTETLAEVSSGAAAAITSDGLIDLFHSLPSFYAQNATWGMNRATISAVRKLKDGAGRYIWNEPISQGNPATILGRPVIEMPDLPNVAAGDNPIVFGDFQQGFRIFDRVAMSLLRDPYSQAANGMTRFHARRRVAAGCVKTEAFRLLKISA
jgi:HK97 family phage major capsid protein/HK97 family phage prohead protease